MTQFQSPTDFILKSVIIEKSGESVDIKKLVATIAYVESITSPFVSAKLQVVDSAGLLQGLPIEQGDKIQISVLTNASEEPIDYNLSIASISYRYAEQRKQTYVLGCVSSEALVDSNMKVTRNLRGNPEKIIADLLINRLKTTKILYSEPSSYEIQMNPNRRRPFEVCSKISTYSVSPKTKKSAGFFFWETRRGYNFFAVDSLCADKDSEFKSERLQTETWGPYIERVANQESDVDSRNNILKSVFTNELDVFKSLRHGRYTSTTATFNISTGQYQEYKFGYIDQYQNQAHLGGQEEIAKIPGVNLEDVGTDIEDGQGRYMSYVIDHERWHNDLSIGSPEPQDGSDSPSRYADRHGEIISYALARYDSLKTQQCSIIVSGNPLICAGDKVDIKLVNKIASVNSFVNPWDVDSSGLYLVDEVTHTYDTTEDRNGRFLTTIRLMRDSLGMK
jgi:hypothetical protein|tara:strand:+ start:1667 stop:3013 length:1347 start_codon:yes stop_codon:yes gene_type:complete